VEYSPEIFGVDDPDFKLPPFENKVTPVSGAIDSGVVGPARWRLFVTYHDSEWEPPRPRGDGQGDGWHYAHTVQALWQSSKTAESVDAGEWGAPIRIKGERNAADTVAVYLMLTPQRVSIETDSGGSIIAGSLPFTARAELFKWGRKIPAVDGIQRFPGNGTNLFDPMLGDFYPEGKDIKFRLAGAPTGVTIDAHGVITIAADAVLKNETSITVRAEYQGAVYSEIFFIEVQNRGNGEALYLGTIDTLPEGPNVMILKGPVSGRVRAYQLNYVLAIADGTVGSRVWKKGYVYQWTGTKWEERSPADHTELYIRCFKDGLDAPGLATDMGWFGALFARTLIAQQAFIETLEAQILKISGVIYGGDRYDEKGNVINANKSGWWLGADGILKAF
jgi:hypothetical protein